MESDFLNTIKTNEFLKELSKQHFSTVEKQPCFEEVKKPLKKIVWVNDMPFDERAKCYAKHRVVKVSEESLFDSTKHYPNR